MESLLRIQPLFIRLKFDRENQDGRYLFDGTQMCLLLRLRIRKTCLIRPIQNSRYRVASCETITVKATNLCYWMDTGGAIGIPSEYLFAGLILICVSNMKNDVEKMNRKKFNFVFLSESLKLNFTVDWETSSLREVKFLQISPEIIQMNLQKFNFVFLNKVWN